MNENKFKPSVFISSTCYDLSQIRTDLKNFIEQQLGFDSILSEYNSFPVNPSLDIVDNCLETVQKHADVFVLIVGGRYGYITESGKSITNLEYINAQSKGIPVYVFVSSQILSNLKVWEANPDGDYSSICDSSQLFEFVKSLYENNSTWVYGFNNVQDIIETLRKQLAYLFFDCLKLKNQINSNKFSSKILELTSDALKIVLNKPIAWEYRLFGQVLCDGINKNADLKRDLKYGVLHKNPTELTNVQQVLAWIPVKVNELSKIVGSLEPLINIALVDALGEPGKPGDADNIVYVANKIIDIYKNAISWGLDFRSVSVPKDFNQLMYYAAIPSESVANDIEEFSNMYNDSLSTAIIKVANGQKPIHLKLTLTLNEMDMSNFDRELQNIRIKYLEEN